MAAHDLLHRPRPRRHRNGDLAGAPVLTMSPVLLAGIATASGWERLITFHTRRLGMDRPEQRLNDGSGGPDSCPGTWHFASSRRSRPVRASQHIRKSATAPQSGLTRKSGWFRSKHQWAVTAMA